MSEEKKTVSSLRQGWKSLGKAVAQDVTMTLKQAKEGTCFLFVRQVKDLYKAGKPVAKGKFRELRDRAALRVHDNLLALGVFGDRTQSQVKAANKRIEERLGIENRDRRPGVVARAYGKPIRDIRRMFDRLRGRGNNQAVPVAVRSTDRSRGNDGR